VKTGVKILAPKQPQIKQPSSFSCCLFGHSEVVPRSPPHYSPQKPHFIAFLSPLVCPLSHKIRSTYCIKRNLVTISEDMTSFKKFFFQIKEVISLRFSYFGTFTLIPILPFYKQGWNENPYVESWPIFSLLFLLNLHS
jgi:hypothetical protein